MAKGNMISFPLSRPGIVADPDCEGEIYDILNEVDHVVRFQKDYEARLNQLVAHREHATAVNPQWFERLRHTDVSLYSMHIASIGNMRVLYVVQKRIILLCAFMEKEGGERKRQGYAQYIPVAKSRMARYKQEA